MAAGSACDKKADLLQRVAAALRTITTKTGGRMRDVTYEDEMVGAEPDNRQRLDHYGNDGEGWDDEGWDRDYAHPLQKEIAEQLAKRIDPKELEELYIDVQEKGFVYIGRKKGK